MALPPPSRGNSGAVLWVARRLGLLEVLPWRPWLVADPDLSKSLVAWQMGERQSPEPGHFRRFVLNWGKTLRHLLTLAAGRSCILCSVRLAFA